MALAPSGDVNMRIVYEKPSWWFLVKLLHPKAEWGKVLFTWGDTIYAWRKMTDPEIAHEAAHTVQQKRNKLIGLFAILRYTFSKSYMKKCELEAFRAQYHAGESLEKTARLMSSPIYKLWSYEEALCALQA